MNTDASVLVDGVSILNSPGLFIIPEDIDIEKSEGNHSEFALDELEAQTYDISLQIRDEMMDDKATAAVYRRHLQNYTMYLAEFHPHISALPITATKVSLFLDHEVKRPKKQANCSLCSARIMAWTLSGHEWD
ncbi:hypothetical protein C8R42DRAFT_646240 [Lentinula raphanica]|nr:hypothetical protein C8R42DRAFT_646240 [Lentinula raphanica]